MPGLVKILKKSAGYKDDWTYTTINKYYPNEDDTQSMALRLVIHLFGDVH